MIPVRAQGLPTVIRTYPDSSGTNYQFGDESIATVYIGPGGNPDNQIKAREGRWLMGAAVVVHAACAGVPAAEPTP